MRQSIVVLALVITLAGVLWAEKAVEKKAPRFEPVEVASLVEPTYPVTSVATGTIILQLKIGKSGEIEDVKVLRDIATLTEAAERVVREWKFKPATLEGRPVRSSIVATFTYNPPLVHWR